MTRFAAAALALMIFFASSAMAQNSNPKVQVFGGYSLVHADTGGLTGAALDSALSQPPGTYGINSNFSGWNSEVQYNWKPRLGFVADFAGHYGNPFSSPNQALVQLPDANEYSIMGGPVYTFKAKSKFTPFVHALVGTERFHLDAGSIPGLFGSSQYVTDWALAAAAGAGVDYKIYPRFSVRLAQVDYYYTGHDLNAIYNHAFGPNVLPNLSSHENNLRFSAGIVVKF
ncbi:MAG: outer membrane beta-barrel protein [Candidatus Sulfotelmatobacter sp.]